MDQLAALVAIIMWVLYAYIVFKWLYEDGVIPYRPVIALLATLMGGITTIISFGVMFAFVFLLKTALGI